MIQRYRNEEKAQPPEFPKGEIEWLSPNETSPRLYSTIATDLHYTYLRSFL